MRILTPHDVGIRLPRLVQVVRIAALAAEQCGVFGALHRLADSVHGQDYCKAFARFDHRFSYYMDWIQHSERRHSQDPFQGPERRVSYSHGELPPDPTPGDPGADARGQEAIERGRASEREREKARDPDITST